MLELVSGLKDGHKWIAGHVPMKQNIVVYVDTRSGEGVQQILGYLKDFIRYQASHITLPSNSTEDIIQELNVIAISAIPEYDVSKKANMLTFLQNHLKNRIINIYKHATEKCRTAVHENFRFCKIRCPKCKQYTIIDECSTVLKYCYSCGNPKKETDVWKSYPIPIPFVSANEEFILQDGSQTTIQEHCSYEDTAILTGWNDKVGEEALVDRLSINNVISTLDVATQQIVNLFLEGHTIVEISRKVDLSTPCVKSKLAALASNKAFIELFT